MTKTRNKLKIMGLVLALVMMVSLLGIFSLTASADSETASGSWGDVADVSFMNDHAGTEEDPYEISTAEQLAGLAALVNESNHFLGKHIKLTADIDLSAHSWVPIGIDTNPPEGASAVFAGFFDGAGHTVSGMTIGTSSVPEDRYQNVGLFGYVLMGEIKNLTVSGSVNLSCPSGKARVGGLVGYLYAGKVINCHSQVNVTVSQNTSGAPCYVGGVVGHGSPFLERNDTRIIGCTNSGTVTVTCTCSEIPACYVGGVAGYIENMNSPFINCFNSGNVKGGTYTGGVVGYAKNDHEIHREMGIYNCANVGSVTGDGHAGGIAGYTESLVAFANCYHAGSVSGAYAGGIVGDINNTGGATFCYWLSTSAESASGDGEGYFYDDCSALSEAQMKAAAGTTDESWEPLYRANAPIALVDALNAYAREISIHNVTCTQWHICSAAGASVYPTYDRCSYTDNGDGNTHKKYYECCEAVVDAEGHFGDVTVTCLGTVCEGCGAYYGDTDSTHHVSTESVCRPDETEPYDYHNQHHACCGALIEDTQERHNDFTYTMEQINDSEQYVFTKTCLTCNGVVGKQYITVPDRPYSGTPYAYATDEMEGNFGLLEGICCCDGGCINEGDHRLTFVLSDQHQFEIPFTITEHTENDHVFDSDSNGFCNVCNAYQPAPLNAKGYYEIGNAGQLYWFAQQVNSGNDAMNGKLTANIVVNENVLTAEGKLNGDGSNFRAWTPIGNLSSNYAGIFDGADFTVSGLYFNGATANYVGLFGLVDIGGKVTNLGVIDSYFHGQDFDGGVGGVVGVNNGSVENCYNASTVSGTESINYYVGGVVGVNSGSVKNCYNMGSVSNTNSSVGGVVGQNDGTVTNCYNEGTVSGAYNVGGLAGNNTKTVTNCYNKGTVSGYEYIGGLIGFNTGTVTNCYYLKDIAASLGEPMTAEQFASGEVAYLLGEAFGQTLGENGDAYPVFVTETNRVYWYTKCDGIATAFTNDSSLANKVAPHTPGENAACTDNKDGTHSFTCAVCEDPITAAHDFDSNELECGVCHASAVSIYGQQLNIGSDLSMKYYVEVFNSVLDVEKLKMMFTINDAVIEAYAGSFNDDGFYVFTLNGINPQCMGDSIYAKLCYNETEVASHGYGEGKEYSVEKNLTNLLEQYEDDVALVTLIKDTLAYGEAASAYKSHQTMKGNAYTENSSNREIPKSEPEHDEKDPNYPLVEQYTVRFGTTLSIKIKASYLPAVKVYVNGKEYVTTEEDVNRGYIIFESDPISATDFDKDFSVIIQNDEGENDSYIHVSVNDYLYAISQSTNASDEMKALAKALYNYGYSAKVYDHVVNGVGEHTTVNGICTLCNENVGYDVDETTATYSVYEAEALQSVLNEASLCDSTVKLMRDLTVDADSYYSLWISSGTVILDLNGYSLTSADEVAILVAEGATLTVRDSGASEIPGAIDALSEGIKTTGIKNEGELFVEGGTILANTFGILNDGILSISGGNVGSKYHVAILGGELHLSGTPHLFNGSENTSGEYLGCDIACCTVYVKTELDEVIYTYYDSQIIGESPNFSEFTGYTLSTDRTCFDKVN